MRYQTILRGEHFEFDSLRELFGKANEEKSGDRLANLAATGERERVAAKCILADLTLRDILCEPLLDPDIDEVSRLILEDVDQETFLEIAHLTVGEFREWLLDSETTGVRLRKYQPAIIPEIAAAVARIMSNKELLFVASKIRNVTRLRNTLGKQNVLAIRIQPNHPKDDLAGILWSTIDGLLMGCGDAVIGVNPVTESVESVSQILRTLDRLIHLGEIPTQACCLAHITTQLDCLNRGVPIDLLFQSIAGTQKANAGFGIDLQQLKEGRQAVLEQLEARSEVSWVGRQVMYFETGQGSALSADAHHGIDQLTLEARAYGVARAFDPLLVNSVVGFIGPEYLFDERQITRAGLEDHFMGKLLGLPMGVDVCYTNHAAADQNSVDNLMTLLAAGGCNYFMGVPATDDVMLNYQTTSYHDAAMCREMLGLSPAPEFLTWLQAHGIFEDGRLLPPDPQVQDRLLDCFKPALQEVALKS